MSGYGEDEPEDFGLFRGLFVAIVFDVAIIAVVGWVIYSLY